MPRAIWIMSPSARFAGIGPSGDDVGERLAVEVLHDHVGGAVAGVALLEDLDDVRVGDLLGALRLATEALAHDGIAREQRVHHLHGEGLIDHLVARA